MQKKSKRRRKSKRSGRRQWIAWANAHVAADRRERGDLPDLTDDQILAWADAFFERTGDWPNSESGPIPESPGETWHAVELALVLGIRGLPRNRSLPRLFSQYRGRYNRKDQHFSISQILAWAEEWRARTGRFPVIESGAIPGAGGITWRTLDNALRVGLGGLQGGSSLLHLLTGERRANGEGPLTLEQILDWADAHHARTGEWPHDRSGIISDSPADSWRTVSIALNRGTRGLPGGSSLAQLLVKERGVRIPAYASPLSVSLILAWADAFHLRTGRWPTILTGPILEAPGETWSGINSALNVGSRGLPGGSTLPRMLARERGARNAAGLPRLTCSEILRWADEFHMRHGVWPNCNSGPIAEAPGETWKRVCSNLKNGCRGFPRGTTLKGLLWEQRGVRYTRLRVSLTVEGILAWCDAHRARTGKWPGPKSGPIPECPRGTWRIVENALKRGVGGLLPGSSISRLLAERRAMRLRSHPPDLTIPQILAWTEAFLARTGRWPDRGAGPIPEAPGETWRMIAQNLQTGRRGLPGGMTLGRLRDQVKRVDSARKAGKHRFEGTHRTGGSNSSVRRTRQTERQRRHDSATP